MITNKSTVTVAQLIANLKAVATALSLKVRHAPRLGSTAYLFTNAAGDEVLLYYYTPDDVHVTEITFTEGRTIRQLSTSNITKHVRARVDRAITSRKTNEEYDRQDAAVAKWHTEAGTQLDAVLNPLGFHRNKGSREWTRNIDTITLDGSDATKNSDNTYSMTDTYSYSINLKNGKLMGELTANTIHTAIRTIDALVNLV